MPCVEIMRRYYQRCRAHGSARTRREETKSPRPVSDDKASQYQKILLTVHFTGVDYRICCCILKFREHVSKKISQ